ncbi:MAG: LON peptidase substrate-binding domain-containing protein, partial [Thermomicrobiales bacterium]
MAPAARRSQTMTPATKPRAAGGARTKKGASRKPPYTLLPVLVVDETLLLPHMSIPFPIEDEEAARVVDRATRGEHRHVLVLTERPVFAASDASSPNGAVADDDSDLRALLADAISEAVAQSAADGDPEWIPDPEPEPQEYELCGVGVIADIAQFRPSGSRHVVLQGLARGIVTELVQQDPYLVARVIRQDDPVDSTTEAEAAMTAVMEQVESYISMLPNVPEEVLTMVRGVEEPGWLADLIAFSPEFTSDQRQDLLEILDPIERLRRLSVLIQKRLDVLNLRQQIQS